MIFKDYIGGNVMCKHIYLCYVDGYIGSFEPETGEVKYDTSDKFVDFVTRILKEYPEHSPHNVINYGIQQAIRDEIEKDKLEQKLYILKGKEK